MQGSMGNFEFKEILKEIKIRPVMNPNQKVHN